MFRCSLLGLISKENQEELANFIATPNLTKLESIDEFLSRILFQNTLEQVNVRECLSDHVKTDLQRDFEVYRRKQVGCGYALLNLDQTEADLQLFTIILKQIGLYASMNDYEQEFLWFIFSQSGR